MQSTCLLFDLHLRGRSGYVAKAPGYWSGDCEFKLQHSQSAAEGPWGSPVKWWQMKPVPALRPLLPNKLGHMTINTTFFSMDAQSNLSFINICQWSLPGPGCPPCTIGVEAMKGCIIVDLFKMSLEWDPRLWHGYKGDSLLAELLGLITHRLSNLIYKGLVWMMVFISTKQDQCTTADWRQRSTSQKRKFGSSVEWIFAYPKSTQQFGLPLLERLSILYLNAGNFSF